MFQTILSRKNFCHVKSQNTLKKKFGKKFQQFFFRFWFFGVLTLYVGKRQQVKSFSFYGTQCCFSEKATISPIQKPSAEEKLAPHVHCRLQKSSYHQKHFRPLGTLYASKVVISSKALSPLSTLPASKVVISNCSVAPIQQFSFTAAIKKGRVGPSTNARTK